MFTDRLRRTTKRHTKRELMLKYDGGGDRERQGARLSTRRGREGKGGKRDPRAQRLALCDPLMKPPK